MRISHEYMLSEFERILLVTGFSQSATKEIAGVFAENSLEGISSHGLNRFGNFIELCAKGIINIDSTSTLENSLGAMEVWNGNMGPGITNARISMGRAVALAKQFGIGCVAIKNTNHWMRGGTYGWQAADSGCISISFTNTTALMVPWGGIEATLGNNPLVIAVPDKKGHIVLDMAVSQFSMGKVNNHVVKGTTLEVNGGYDEKGDMTKDPKEIIDSGKLLPIGFWKGTGLALMLDLICTLLSSGRSTAEISEDQIEHSVSQVFICISPDIHRVGYDEAIHKILSYFKSSNPGGAVRFPGEHIKKIRAYNLLNGIPVDENKWAQILAIR